MLTELSTQMCMILSFILIEFYNKFDSDNIHENTMSSEEMVTPIGKTNITIDIKEQLPVKIYFDHGFVFIDQFDRDINLNTP